MNCVVRISYQGEELAILSDEEKGGLRILKGNIVGSMGRLYQRDVEFQIPLEKKDLRLALISPFGWVLVDEKTGKAWMVDVSFPNNTVKVPLPLTRK